MKDTVDKDKLFGPNRPCQYVFSLVSWNCFTKSVCICVYVGMYVCLFAFLHPREQTFYLKYGSSLYANNKG